MLTREKLEKKLKEANESKERLIALFQQVVGQIAILTDLLKEIDKPEENKPEA